MPELEVEPVPLPELEVEPVPALQDSAVPTTNDPPDRPNVFAIKVNGWGTPAPPERLTAASGKYSIPLIVPFALPLKLAGVVLVRD